MIRYLRFVTTTYTIAVYYRKLGEMAAAHERLAEDTPTSRWYRVTPSIVHLTSDCFLVAPYPVPKSFRELT
jgi:hypothetical protein